MSIREIERKLEQLQLDWKYKITSVEYSGDDTIAIPDPGLTGLTYHADTLKEMGISPFYRIALTISAEPGSAVHAEVWLPETGWNERIVTIGNGASARIMAYTYMMGIIRDRYCVIHGDLGTAGEDFHEGYRHPYMWADFGNRATHLMTEAGKRIARLVYEKPHRFAYFYGHSTGGQQALVSAQEHPGDFNGIIANEPAVGRTGLHYYFLWVAKCLFREDMSPRFTLEELGRVREIVLAELNKLGDGVPGDGFLSDPVFALEHTGEAIDAVERAGILSNEQMQAFRDMVRGPFDPVTGERLFAGLPVCGTGMIFMLYLFSNDLNAEWFYPLCWGTGVSTRDFKLHAFDYHKDVEKMERLANSLNADQTDLRSFRDRGGKLLMLGGAQDDLIPIHTLSDYYERVVKEMGGLEETEKFFRFFLIPGYGHGFSAMPEGDLAVTGVNEDSDTVFHTSSPFGPMRPVQALDAIIRWVEQDEAPAALLYTVYDSAKSTDSSLVRVRQRPIFPYPDHSVYQGSNLDQASSFVMKKGSLGISPARTDRFWNR